MKDFFKENGPWLWLFGVTDLVFIFLTWLLRPEAIGRVGLFLLLFSLGAAGLGAALQRRRRRRIQDAARLFLENPCDTTKAALVAAAGRSWAPLLERAFLTLREQAEELKAQESGLKSYREYIEAWVHEIKTPLSLMTLVLENHREEMSAYTHGRLEHARQQTAQDVECILYYARLQADHVDYRFSRFRLDECVREALAEYSALAAERSIRLTLEPQPLEVVADRKVLLFILSQLLSNAVKYASPDCGEVVVSMAQDPGDEGKIRLLVLDNGPGVPPEDLPFILDKGFTGSHPDRQKATGMGLYLADKYARALNLELRPQPVPPKGFGFGIELLFPFVR